MQSVDRKASFLLVGDVNAHHEEGLGSSATHLHGRVARVFASSSDCKQMVMEPTHIDGGVLNLVLTDVPDVVRIRVVRLLESQIIAPFLYALWWSNLFLTCYIGRRSILRTLWTRSWLEVM